MLDFGLAFRNWERPLRNNPVDLGLGVRREIRNRHLGLHHIIHTRALCNILMTSRKEPVLSELLVRPRLADNTQTTLVRLLLSEKSICIIDVQFLWSKTFCGQDPSPDVSESCLKLV